MGVSVLYLLDPVDDIPDVGRADVVDAGNPREARRGLDVLSGCSTGEAVARRMCMAFFGEDGPAKGLEDFSFLAVSRMAGAWMDAGMPPTLAWLHKSLEDPRWLEADPVLAGRVPEGLKTLANHPRSLFRSHTDWLRGCLSGLVLGPLAAVFRHNPGGMVRPAMLGGTGDTLVFRSGNGFLAGKAAKRLVLLDFLAGSERGQVEIRDGKGNVGAGVADGVF